MTEETTPITPGLVVLLGSGETLPSSGKTHEYVARRLPAKPNIAILETPAGFEPNSDLVAGKIKTFLDRRLQNYQPNVSVLPARRRGTYFSPDNPEVVKPLLTADEILLGPGSPTYGARQLRNSLALQYMRARHRLGATIFLSSSATLACSRHTMAVYEIYKVGEDLHWKPGADFLGPFGLPISVIPHWDNTDGGDELDTSRCYMGRARFGRLLNLLPANQTIIGIDEHTSVIVDFSTEACHILGKGNVTILRNGREMIYRSEDSFPLSVLGQWQMPDNSDLNPGIWDTVLEAKAARKAAAEAARTPSDDVLALLAARREAREARNWTEADRLRDEIEALGWQVNDTEEGAELVALE